MQFLSGAVIFWKERMNGFKVAYVNSVLESKLLYDLYVINEQFMNRNDRAA